MSSETLRLHLGDAANRGRVRRVGHRRRGHGRLELVSNDVFFEIDRPGGTTGANTYLAESAAQRQTTEDAIAVRHLVIEDASRERARSNLVAHGGRRRQAHRDSTLLATGGGRRRPSTAKLEVVVVEAVVLLVLAAAARDIDLLGGRGASNGLDAHIGIRRRLVARAAAECVPLAKQRGAGGGCAQSDRTACKRLGWRVGNGHGLRGSLGTDGDGVGGHCGCGDAEVSSGEKPESGRGVGNLKPQRLFGVAGRV